MCIQGSLTLMLVQQEIIKDQLYHERATTDSIWAEIYKLSRLSGHKWARIIISHTNWHFRKRIGLDSAEQVFNLSLRLKQRFN